jgi:hypothetical protein
MQFFRNYQGDLMDKVQWFSLLRRAFLSMDDRLEQVLQLSSCREHWIQAEISLYAYYHDRLDIWTDCPLGSGRKADLYTGDPTAPSMVAELKCLGDYSQAKCLEGEWSVRKDIARLKDSSCGVRLFILVIPHHKKTTETGRLLRETDWMPGNECETVDLQCALIRMWAV